MTILMSFAVWIQITATSLLLVGLQTSSIGGRPSPQTQNLLCWLYSSTASMFQPASVPSGTLFCRDPMDGCLC